MTTNSDDTVLEIVWFRLQAGADPSAFVQAARQTETLLRRCPGFVRRMLVEDQNLWGDLVEWRDRASAMAAAETVLQDAAFAPFIAMIDPGTLRLGHHAIRARMA